MNRSILTGLLLLLVPSLIGVSEVWAQTEALDNPVCNAQFARLLVDQQVSESKSVVEPVKRIKILLRSADFLWKFDEPKARAYFAEAYKTADDNFKANGFESKKSGDKGSSFSMRLPDQRMKVIAAIASKDAVWARKLSAQVLAEYDKSAADRDAKDKTREIGDLLTLAQENVKTNPDLARYLFRKLMQYPLIVDWYWTLYQVAISDQRFADALYGDALISYQNETPRRLLFLSAYPFASERIVGIDKFMYGGSVPANLQSNSNLERRFLEVFFARIARFASSEEDIQRPADEHSQPEPVYMVSALRDLEPIIIEQFPDMIGRLSSAKAQAASLLNEEMRKKMEEKADQTSALGKGFDERLAELQKADEEGKLTDYMIISLATWTDKTEEQFKRLEPWMDKIKDENARRETSQYFWFLRAKRAIQEKRTEDAETFANKIAEIEYRTLLMYEIANVQMENVNDSAKVFETLNRVSKLTHSVENSVAKAQMLLALANKYERVNHSVALDELGEAIRVINSLDDPDIFATSITRRIAGKGFMFFAVIDIPGYNLEDTFSEISKRDFELSLANAKALDDKYFRTLAVIAVAGNCVKNAAPAVKKK